MNLSGYVISKRDYSAKRLKDIKSDLTIIPVKKDDSIKVLPVRNYVETDGELILPTYYGKKKICNVKGDDDEHTCTRIDVQFSGSLKEEQTDPYKAMYSHMAENRTGIFSASTGLGKSVLALKLISDIGVKTLIVSAATNQVGLMKQWGREIDKFLPFASVGTMQGPVCDVEGKDVVLTTISSLRSRDYDLEGAGIGMVVIDECFVPWTSIQTSGGDRDIFNICEDVRLGRAVHVKSFDKKTHKIVTKKVLNYFEKEVNSPFVHMEIEVMGSIKSFICTRSHRFLLVNMTWKCAGDIDKSDMLMYCDGRDLNFINVYSKHEIALPVRVYDLEVEDTHNYVLGCGLVAHNCHHASAPSSARALFKLGKIPYMMGISATPSRPDGLSRVLEQWMGPVFYNYVHRRKGLQAIVNVVELTSGEYTEHYTRVMGKEKICFTRMISDLVRMDRRNMLLIDATKKCVEEGRTVLLVSERVEHIKFLGEQLGGDVGLYFGTGSTEQSRREALSRKVIFATVQSFGEGIDKPDLDTLILATPRKHEKGDTKNNINASISFTQIVGRIFRKEHKERNPLIIDFLDAFSVYNYQGRSRMSYYKEFVKPIEINKISIDLDSYEKGSYACARPLSPPPIAELVL